MNNQQFQFLDQYLPFASSSCFQGKYLFKNSIWHVFRNVWWIDYHVQQQNYIIKVCNFVEYSHFYAVYKMKYFSSTYESITVKIYALSQQEAVYTIFLPLWLVCDLVTNVSFWKWDSKTSLDSALSINRRNWYFLHFPLSFPILFQSGYSNKYAYVSDCFIVVLLFSINLMMRIFFSEVFVDVKKLSRRL